MLSRNEEDEGETQDPPSQPEGGAPAAVPGLVGIDVVPE
jgi:hypothetical protein